MLFLMIASLMPLGTGAVGGLDLEQLNRAEVVVVGSIKSEQPQVQYAVRKCGDAGHRMAFGVYSVTVDGFVKGKASGTITVLAGSSTDSTGWGPHGAKTRADALTLPVGKRLLLYLQPATAGKFALDSTGTADDVDRFIEAPDGVGFALYDFSGTPRRFVISDAAFQRLTLKHDYAGRDVARILVAAKDETPDAVRISVGLDRLMWLWPEPPIKLLTESGGEAGDPVCAACTKLLGPDPFTFFKDELAPMLPALNDVPEFDRKLETLMVSGRWGDPSAASQLAGLVLAQELPTDATLRTKCAGAAAAVRHMFGHEDASARLLASPIPEAKVAALFALAGSHKYRSLVKEALASDDADVLRQAVQSLACTDSDFGHDLRDGGFEPGSENARVLSYWRNKP